MKVNELNTIAQTLDRIGSQHLGMDRQGQIVQTTSSLRGRIINWIRSRHSDTAALANRNVMNGIIDMIRHTDGLGERFVDLACQKLQSRLASGRPLNGRDAARIMRDIIRIKTDEDAAQAETRSLNALGLHEQLCAPGADGTSPMAERLAAKRTLFGLNAATPEQLRAFQDAAKEGLLAAARRADHSLTVEEGLAVLDEAARKLSLQEARDGIKAMADRVTGDGPGGFEERLTAAMQAKGLSGEISASLREALAGKIHDKLAARCLYDRDNMHQPTLEEAGTVADAVIGELVDALDTVQRSDLPESVKPAVQKTLLHASMPVTSGMAQAVCDAVEDTTLFLAELRRSDATPQDLQAGFDAYVATLHNAITQPDGNLRPGIAGGPEAGETRRLTAQAACLLSGFDAVNPLTGEEARLHDRMLLEDQPVPAELAARHGSFLAAQEAMNSIMRTGSSLHVMHYTQQQNPDPGVRTQSELMLMNLLEVLNDAGGKAADMFLRPAGLGQMSMAQARQFVPEGMGIPAQGGRSFNFEAAKQRMKDEMAVTVADTPPGSGASLVSGVSPQFAAKLNAFSEQFLKDFYRNGVTVNGRLIGRGVGTNDRAAMEAALDELIAQFPSLEEAGRVCSPLHQGFGSHFIKVFVRDPHTSQRMMNHMGVPGEGLSSSMDISIDVHSDGSYSVHVEHCAQKVTRNIPGGSEGFNVAADYSLPNGNSPLAFSVTDFDVLFNVVRPQ